MTALRTAPMADMTDAEFRMFCELFRSHCGLSFGPESRYLLEKRLARRVHALDLGSFAAYHFMLRNDSRGDDELGRAIDDLTTNETYLFRELGPIRALVDEIIPELLDRKRLAGGGALSIWSAGCSSGEEPYSVLMMALEAGYLPGRDLHLYASDISRTMLQKARGGIYREASFRETDPYFREKYFRSKDDSFRISDDLKRHVDFIHLNLLDASKIALLGTMDVILCRNVIIYFDLETKGRVISTFANKLIPGGFLLLGHSESLLNISNDFELEHLRNDMVYRRPVPGETREDRWHVAARAAIARADAGKGSS